YLAHGLRERRFGLRQRNVGGFGVHLHQYLAVAHIGVVVGSDADYRARLLRRDLHHVAVDVRIVGALVPAADQEVIKRPDDRDDHDDADQAEQQPAALVQAFDLELVGAFVVGNGIGIDGRSHCLALSADGGVEVMVASAGASLAGTKPPPSASFKEAHALLRWVCTEASCCSTAINSWRTLSASRKLPTPAR